MLEPKYIVKFGEKVPEEALANHGELSLLVSEFFFDTIQGEGMSVGQPAAFLRLGGCPVGCEFCDTTAVWSKSQRIKIDWLIQQIVKSGLGKKLEDGDEMLVVTGGSPLAQQEHLVEFFKALDNKLTAYPYVEVENEGYYAIEDRIKNYVHWWNNSPKLSNSGVPKDRRYRNSLKTIPYNSTFKFVVKDEEDWDEIQRDFIDKGLCNKYQICLMPMGASQEEYFANREKVVELAVKHGVRYSPREHIAIWDKKTGI